MKNGRKENRDQVSGNREEDSDQESEDSVESQAPRAESAKPLVWMAKKVVITGHDLCYHDYSMRHEWEYAVKTLKVEGSNIATNGRNSVKAKATLTSDAQLNLDFTGGPDIANQDTRATLKITGVPLTDFDALCRNYTGYALDGGEMNVESTLDVTSGQMTGNNKIVIEHPRVGKKEKFSKAPYKDLPIKLGVHLLTSAQDMIVLEVPVKGDARSPKFDFGKVVSRALLKVFFGPLMGVNDGDKRISTEEMEELQELLGESAADVAVSAGDSTELTEIVE